MVNKMSVDELGGRQDVGRQAGGPRGVGLRPVGRLGVGLRLAVVPSKLVTKETGARGREIVSRQGKGW
jgi:hypothetical protein